MNKKEKEKEKKKDQPNHPHMVEHNAVEEAAALEDTLKHDLSQYKLAFTDQEFLLRQELRPVRLQLELLKPELIQQDHNIESTIVIFGSARIPEPSVANARLERAKELAAKQPDNQELAQAVAIAKRLKAKSHFYTEAKKLAKIISTSEYGAHLVIKTGGGPGIMEAANRGAYEANAKSVALNVAVPHERETNPFITPELTFRFHYFAIRKMHFFIRARALVAFPGGYGSMDELFEALTLLQTNKIPSLPVLLFGKAYWTKIINFQALVDEGVISPQDLNLFQFVETAEEAWQAIQEYYKNNEKQP